MGKVREGGFGFGHIGFMLDLKLHSYVGYISYIFSCTIVVCLLDCHTNALTFPLHPTETSMIIVKTS